MSRKIKRSLAGGALAAIITVLLMLGSTMAWFQDTEVLINTFTFGAFKVDIIEVDSTNSKRTVGFRKSDGTLFENGEQFLFEPGATFVLEEFRVKNNGTVPFNYEVELQLMSPENENHIELMNTDAMETQIKSGENPVQALDSFNAGGQRLEADEISAPIQLRLHMKEDVGNEYNCRNGRVFSKFRIRVLAYQEGANAEIAREHANAAAQ